LDEPTTTLNNTDGEQFFTIIHPFHPLSGQQFPLIYQRNTWGEPRVGFHDPLTGCVRSIPIAWTNLANIDPFVSQAAGRAIIRLVDLQALVKLLDDLAERPELTTKHIIDSPNAFPFYENEGGE
jgi:hypothetical protein